MTDRTYHTKRMSISVKDKVYERLKKYGRFGESYSELILRLIEEVEEKEKEKEKKGNE